MIVDAVVLLSISHYGQHTHQFASILLGDGTHVTESYETGCDIGAIPTLAMEKYELAQKVDPHLKLMGYALVNYDDIPPKLSATNGYFLWHLRLQSPIYSQGYKCDDDHWSLTDICVRSDPNTEIAVNDSLGASNEFDLHRAKEVLIQRIRCLRQKLAQCQSSPSDPSARQQIGEIIMKTGQLRKIIPQLAELTLEERDSVNFEVMAQLIEKFSH